MKLTNKKRIKALHNMVMDIKGENINMYLPDGHGLCQLRNIKDVIGIILDELGMVVQGQSDIRLVTRP